MTDAILSGFSPRNVITISPGPVGPVGDVLCQTRLKHSNPDLPLRWEAWNSGPNEVFLGSNVQDGYKRSYVSSGGPAESILHGNKRLGTRDGERIINLNTPTNMMTPQMGSLGDYDWRNKQATVYESNRTGYKFLPLPFGYDLPPGQVPRAGGLIRSIMYGSTPTFKAPVYGRPGGQVPQPSQGSGGGGGTPAGSGGTQAKPKSECKTPVVGGASLYKKAT